MKILKLILFSTLLIFLSAENAPAASQEKEISLDDLEDRSLSLQNLSPLNLPGKSYDDRAHQTIITGYAVTSYRFNDNGVDAPSGNELIFGQDPADTADFAFNVMEIGFTKRYSDLLWFAGSFEISQHFEDGSTVTETELSLGEVHLVAPIGNGIDFTLGKFNSPVSFEREDAPLLLQATHSLAFQFASPAKMTGLMITYPFMENLEIRGVAFNGWDRNTGAGDNNNAKSLLFQVGFAPTQRIDTKFSILWGAEQDDNEKDTRTVFDAVATLTPGKNLIVGLEFAYGIDQNGSAINPGTDAEWTSGQATIHYDFIRWFGTTFRYSFFDDKDGHPDLAPRQKRTMNEVTFASTFHLSPEMLGFMGFGVIPRTRHLLSGIDLRLEYRYDWINEASAGAFFEDARDTKLSTRNTFIAELVANF